MDGPARTTDRGLNRKLMRAAFVSDLHLFSRRSRGARHLPAIQQATRSTGTMVLGGDIFDFKWSTIPSTEATVAAAGRWLTNLITLDASCQIHYILGNHDYQPALMTLLDRLANTHANFVWHDYYLRLNRTLFLHGDVADRPMTHQELVTRRQRKLTDQRAAVPRHWLYSAAMAVRLHKVAGWVAHAPDRVASRIEHYVSSLNLADSGSIQQIVFGHTHAALHGHVYNGVYYFNGGAPLAGLKFGIVEVNL